MGHCLMSHTDALKETLREAEPPPVSAVAEQMSLSVSSHALRLFWTVYRVFIQTEANVGPFKALT